MPRKESPAFRIKLEESTRGRAMLERTPRYDILVNGEVQGQLSYNMRGYIGYLPTIHGSKMDIGEKSISAFRKEIRILNREAEEAIAREIAGQRRIARVLPTEDSRIVAAVTMAETDNPEILFISKRSLSVAKTIFGRDDVSADFFEGQAYPHSEAGKVLFESETDWAIRAFPQLDHRVMDAKEADRHHREILGVFDTVDHETLVLVTARADDDPDPDFSYVSRFEYDFARARMGDDIRLSDLKRTMEEKPLKDLTDLPRINELLGGPWLDPDAGRLDAAQRHQREQEGLTGPEA